MEEIIRHKKIERDCGDCSLCCKLHRTDFKEEYQWCKSCDVGNGCKIYNTRPQVCKDFKCLWKPGMCEERLKPNKIEDDLINLEKLKEYLFKLRYTLAKMKSSPDWTLKDLERALKTFKNKKCS